MIRVRSVLAVVAAAGLSACGGSGGGGLVTTPPPPMTQTNASLTSLQYNQDFSGSAGVIQYALSRSSGGATPRTGNAAVNGAAQVRYDASTQSYTLIGTALPTSTFTATDRQAASSTATITAYQKINGSKQENLALFVPGSGNAELALTYASYGAYQAITSNSATLDVDTAFFTYGVLTAPSDMPRTGSATYTSKIDGQYADAGGAYVLAGSSSFAADFAAATVAFSMAPVGQNVVTGALKSFPTQTVNGQITSGNQFGGTGSVGGYNTSLNGYFYGPAAAEIGGTFAITGNGGGGVGALVGKKN